ncbi:adenosylcobinamide kinase /adenosylcobinamide-phosphate guanylyltransferase [Acinetobacter pittii]|jgi:adenosylcobinamide kinase/adenosylcobinamide-phosphate guanylyltransferase|uniref:bifunctional adenosylcobinamide kinase/adenosylcobinamide-phosphate guanylyltransferase n=1 Tax=Acinetobacter TaxID=469 RepID=UPI00044EC578|nr:MULTISPECIES: bifunctional adenosylcobinamide kinase/adenosylcobinamide-phosphate guanylyltransferase [Acinetobacter]EXE89458.1 cobinamide kinase / cobinamide phosphate guanyltransferase family protein [Acinetobacter sp. 1578804]KCX16762.1 cobinamide kinase / cobinamide phosphate guanyltransferase family protein [Acinetobacter sp. 1264765]KQE19898.1 adenosylcobinamide kinase/adenosylcobinamide phosphate guanyltransferase [Acinetobacter pittii]KQE21700.1 adenosylcobinamide kinase/adenosylcobi
MLQLILGGARSGKSRLAEQTAMDRQLAVTYVATAQALDFEMQSRITHHQNQRPSHWSLVEEPLYLANALQKINRPNQIILVDCLTLWLTNLLLLEDQNVQQFECEQLLKVLPTLQSEIILVSNETGLGVVPLGEISRRFVDEAGRLHQALGQIADKVVFCVAGFPMILKGEK